MKSEYLKLQDALDRLRVLFDDELPEVYFVLQRKRGALGYFWADQWREIEGKDKVHELALTPDNLSRPPLEVLGTLAHELAHLWQEVHGKPGADGYHNKEWADKMEEIGLEPYCVTDEGKRTGKRCSHNIPEEGNFREVADEILADGWKLDYAAVPNIAKSKTTRKVSYKCECATVYGKPGLNIECQDCGLWMEEQ
jgi:predicted SprT family Zn-dependent metalloprotease